MRHIDENTFWQIKTEKRKEEKKLSVVMHIVKVVLIIEVMKTIPPIGRVPFISQYGVDKTFNEGKSPILLKNSFSRLEL